MIITAHTTPFRHWELSNLITADEAASVRDNLPAADWPGWIRYSSHWERNKRTTRDLSVMPWAIVSKLVSPEFVKQLGQLSGIPDLIPDPYWHGAGIHIIDPGGYLGCHIDYAKHPAAEFLERRLSLVLFCSWHDCGQLRMWNDDASESLVSYYPKAGNAVLFENSDVSFHSVEPVAERPRITIATYYCSPLRPGAVRKRALWVPERG